MSNLDFFHYILPPFCISSQLRPFHIFSLGYISAFYPFLLILLTWLCVELHGRNFRPIVCLWRPFHGCFVRLRRGWNTKSDLIDVFASFFLLSYSKTLYQTILTFDNEEIINYSLTSGTESHGYVLKADLSVITFKTFNPQFIIFMMCFVVLLTVLFVIFSCAFAVTLSNESSPEIALKMYEQQTLDISQHFYREISMLLQRWT